MPTYEYECNKGHHFEVTQRITEPPLERCQVCRSKARRLISSGNFILKGGGWYSDGYSSSGAKSSGSNGSDNGKSSSAPAKSGSSTSSGDTSSSSSDAS